jgi:GNAT superfamily N-acetyltransferase
MNVRTYNPETDYPSVASLLRNPKTYGGEFDEARDSKERIDALEASKPGSVLVAEINNEIIGTVTLFEDGRSAWLYRFAVKREYEKQATKALWATAEETMKSRGHTQVLVYAPAKNVSFKDRYTNLGFNTGNDFTAYWQDIK